MLKTLKTKTQLMSAAIMTGAMTSSILPTIAHAQQLDDYLKTTSGRVNNIPDLIAFICYLAGAAFAGLGVLGLKQHVENPQGVALKVPLAKLGFGGMLLAIPTLTNVMQDTATADAGNAAYGGFASGGITIQ